MLTHGSVREAWEGQTHVARVEWNKHANANKYIGVKVNEGVEGRQPCYAPTQIRTVWERHAQVGRGNRNTHSTIYMFVLRVKDDIEGRQPICIASSLCSQTAQ